MITRFTAYRRHVSSSARHDDTTRNPDGDPQFEGVVFSDGRVVLHWLTPAGGLSVFESLQAAMATHGHPELGTDIVWHDGNVPAEWEQQLVQHAEHEQAMLHGVGLTQVAVVAEHDADGNLTRIVLRTPLGKFEKQLYPPVPHD